VIRRFHGGYQRRRGATTKQQVPRTCGATRHFWDCAARCQNVVTTYDTRRRAEEVAQDLARVTSRTGDGDGVDAESGFTFSRPHQQPRRRRRTHVGAVRHRRFIIAATVNDTASGFHDASTIPTANRRATDAAGRRSGSRSRRRRLKTTTLGILTSIFRVALRCA